MAKKKTAKKATKKKVAKKATKKKVGKNQTAKGAVAAFSVYAPEGGCIWMKVGNSWSKFDSCGESCECSSESQPPNVDPNSPPGTVVVTLCVPKSIGPAFAAQSTTVLCQGSTFVNAATKVTKKNAADFRISISLGAGGWRYFHSGKNASRSKTSGHLDNIVMPKGIISIDRMDSSGKRSVALVGLGFIELTLG